MANQYFVFKKTPKIGEAFVIEDKAAAHHIFTVMRAQTGEHLRLVFTDGKIGLSEVISPNEQSVKLLELLTDTSELPVQVTVAVGFPKGDKLEFITEKSTELGATAIWSAPFKASVSKWDSKKLAKKQEKLEKIALGAAEQSRRQMIPEVQLFEQFTALVDKFSDFDQVLIAYEESAKTGEKTMFKQALTEMSANQKVLVIFGPEGGISPAEITKFTDLGAKLIGLGPRILRAETAPLYALSSISAYFELL
jgi:16S rRNA (uracil1498-N3)-methyltransferase